MVALVDVHNLVPGHHLAWELLDAFEFIVRTVLVNYLHSCMSVVVRKKKKQKRRTSRGHSVSKHLTRGQQAVYWNAMIASKAHVHSLVILTIVVGTIGGWVLSHEEVLVLKYAPCLNEELKCFLVSQVSDSVKTSYEENQQTQMHTRSVMLVLHMQTHTHTDTHTQLKGLP